MIHKSGALGSAFWLLVRPLSVVCLPLTAAMNTNDAPLLLSF